MGWVIIVGLRKVTKDIFDDPWCLLDYNKN